MKSLFPEVQYFIGMSKVSLGNIEDLANYMNSNRVKVLQLIVSCFIVQ